MEKTRMEKTRMEKTRMENRGWRMEDGVRSLRRFHLHPPSSILDPRFRSPRSARKLHRRPPAGAYRGAGMLDVLNSDECSKYLKALADPDRLRIVECLLGGPKAVGEIVREIDT